jgi:hypothetical protein
VCTVLAGHGLVGVEAAIGLRIRRLPGEQKNKQGDRLAKEWILASTSLEHFDGFG